MVPKDYENYLRIFTAKCGIRTVDSCSECSTGNGDWRCEGNCIWCDGNCVSFSSKGKSHCSKNESIQIATSYKVFDFIIGGLALSIIGICGVIGNAMSLVILTKPQMKSSTSFILVGKFIREPSSRMDLIKKVISKVPFLIKIKHLKFLAKTHL